MNPQQSKAATKATLGLGALCTIAALAYATGGASSLLKAGHLAIWSLLPYAVLLVSTALAGTRGRALAAFIVSVLVSGYGLFIYSDALFVHLSSTGGLVFLFIPLYQLITAIIFLLVLFFSRHSDVNRNT
jgi:hypothetical protein